jgi:hypothetical protein
LIVLPKSLSLAVFLAVLAAGAAQAQQGFFFTSPLRMGGTRESKFIVDNEELSDSVLLILPPEVSYVSLRPRSEFALSYQPELQMFAAYRDLNAVNHLAELHLLQRLTPRFTVSAGNTFISTADPSRRIIDSVILLPRDRIMENTFFLELARQFGRNTTFSVRGDSTLTRIAAPDTTRTEMDDRLGSSGSVTLTQAIARRNRVSATYTYLDARPIGQVTPRRYPFTTMVLATPDHAHSTGLGFVHEGDAFAIRLAGGLVYSRDVAYTGSASIDKTLGRDALLTLSAQRSLTFFGGVLPQYDIRLGSGLAPLTFFEALTVRIRGDLSRKLSVTGVLSGQRTFSDLTTLEVRSDLARLRLDYHVSRTFSLFGTVELYRQSFNEFVGVPLNWQRVGMGMEFAMTHKPNPLKERQKERSLRERRARRGEAEEEDLDTAPETGVSSEPDPFDTPEPTDEGDADADTRTR